MRLIYDITPPQVVKEKKAEKIENGFLRIVSLLLIIGIFFNWAGFSKIIDTISYLSDTESSADNSFTAGALDFVLGSPDDFMPSPIGPGESTHREINFLNLNNYPKYQVEATEFIGELCDDLILEYSLDGGTSVSQNLIGFVSPIVDFVDPDVWSFKLTLPANAPETVQGQTCQFKFIFFGSQIKNDLPFGTGFNDTEEIINHIAAESCQEYEIKSQGYWKNHPEIYVYYLPQNLGDYVVDTTTKANAVFEECGGRDMSDKLRCQLLAMKFNIAHFGVGDYFVESCGCDDGRCGDCIKDVNKTINQIVAEADDLLTPPQGTFSEMEDMKDLLDCLNNLEHVKICGMGGEGPMILINKVYYDVDNEHGTEGDNEFIELYNPSREPMDISGWIIADNNSEDTIPASTIIPGHGYALIAGNNSTFGFWDIPDEVIKIVLADGNIGDGLDDDSDRVILKSPATPENPVGIEVDKMSYGTDIYAFDPACPDVDEGHMLGRYPNGWDTDTAADWKDYGLPTIHVDYPNGGEVWYVGRYYTITWTATNPSGNNSDIIIDLYYSADSGATWGNIVRATENDGQYRWRVPLFIGHMGTGYYVPSDKARIKAVARNVNNFMVNDWDMTDRDFCPPIDYEELTPEEAAYLMSLEGMMYSPEENTFEGVVDTVENFVGNLLGEISNEPISNKQVSNEPVSDEPISNEAGEPTFVPTDVETTAGTPVEVPVDEPLLETDNNQPIILPEEIILPTIDNLILEPSPDEGTVNNE